MSTPAIVGPLTPYIVSNGGLLESWPTGVDFSTIPMGTTITAGQKAAALANMCMSATVQAEEYVNQPLRAMLATEEQSGPDYYVTIQNGSGLGRMILQRWPITQITGVQVAAAAGFPRQWTTVPSGYWDIERPIIGSYGTNAPTGSGEGGQAVLIAPGYVNGCNGRNGLRIKVTYVHGWPHTSLTASPDQGATTISVDDVTGWAPAASGDNGCTGVVYDGASQEVVQCTAASVSAGPGTLTLASGLQFAHDSGVMVSSLPSNAIWATALFVGADALTRGATTTTVRSFPGHAGGPSGAEELRVEAMLKLHPYRVSV